MVECSDWILQDRQQCITDELRTRAPLQFGPMAVTGADIVAANALVVADGGGAEKLVVVPSSARTAYGTGEPVSLVWHALAWTNGCRTRALARVRTTVCGGGNHQRRVPSPGGDDVDSIRPQRDARGRPRRHPARTVGRRNRIVPPTCRQRWAPCHSLGQWAGTPRWPASAS